MRTVIEADEMHQQRNLAAFRLKLREDDVGCARLSGNGLKIAFVARHAQNRRVADDADAIGAEPRETIDDRIRHNTERAVVPAVSCLVVKD
jgi:hypothetical protein